MQLLALIPAYLFWHYGTAFRDIITLWGNMFWFAYNFFSVPTLLKTFFSPWKRMHEEAREGFHPKEFFSAFIINTMMRGVGMAMRSFLLGFAVIFLIAIFLGGIFALVLWPLLPLLAGAFVVFGVVLIYKNI